VIYPSVNQWQELKYNDLRYVTVVCCLVCVICALSICESMAGYEAQRLEVRCRRHVCLVCMICALVICEAVAGVGANNFRYAAVVCFLVMHE